MSPRTLSDHTVREVPLLREDEQVGAAVSTIVQAEVPALPVVDEGERLRGIFGEREFISAVFPGYLGQLHYAGFVTKATDDWIDKRADCVYAPVSKYMNTEHVDVGTDYSDAQLAETFMHHRVLIIPITDGGRVTGIVTRWEFFRALAERLASR
ncbi:MAG TPA: CBS domain-containing protein [Thermoleophilaceae bacterium]|nr:CBS domain-containing protein [Thermoleophilaceae bacterium]